jgi:hypothetical protein
MLFYTPCLVFLAHAYLFRNWLIDDAGITFAYARNLAFGHGLVSQPGFPPVEGYSNFLWTVIIALFFKLQLFDPTITPKILSVLIVLATFYVLHKMITQVMLQGRFVSMVTLTLLAINSSFVIWCTSGLENPLYVLLLSGLLYLSIKTIIIGYVANRTSVFAAILGAGAAMTRPEGMVYSVIFPLVLVIAGIYCRDKSRKQFVKSFLIYSLAYASIFGGFLLFRFAYFHSLTPNTFVAKGGPTSDDVIALLLFDPNMVSKAIKLIGSVTSEFGGIFIAFFFALTVYRISIRRLRLEHGFLLIFLIFSLVVYLIMPRDWMGEYRFAVPFFIFFYIYAVVLVKTAIADLNLAERCKTKMMGLIAVLAIAGSLPTFAWRSSAWSIKPIVPFDRIARQYGMGFNRCADVIDVKNGSVLLPDLGGMLYYSDLKVYDLAGLCDKTIAKTLRKDYKKLHDYIFDVVKPTFIHTHGIWTYAASLDDDPRLRRDYVPIRKSVNQFVKLRFNRTMYSGDYVRKDAIQGKDGSLEALRNTLEMASKP